MIASNIGNASVYDAMRAEALTLVDGAAHAGDMDSARMAQNRRPDRSALGPTETKEFLEVLTPKVFRFDSALVRFALQEEFVEIANEYLGQKARLRAVHLWRNVPTSGPPASTQLWHRDADDFRNLKIFIYLTDVGLRNGPFAFIPGSQPLGRRLIRPAGNDTGRTTDEEMERIVPRSEWRICTGRAGSVVFADTCGFHKGVKPLEGHRLMMMVHFVSRAAYTEVDLQIEGAAPSWLTKGQRDALDQIG